MTAQIEDKLLFQGEEYRIIGIQGDGMFSPDQVGMTPVMLHTACYCGFYLSYELSEQDGLLLQELTLREQDNNYLPVNDIQPEIRDFNAAYRGLNLPVQFTGRIRIGKDFIQDLYIHMGYQKPDAFRTVLDLTLEDGKLTDIQDRSSEMASLRGNSKNRYHSGEIMDSVRNAFSLDIDPE